MKNTRKLLGIILALLLAILLRTLWLDRIPIGISDDELDYVLTAQSISYTGKNLNGTYSPFSFQSLSPDTQVPIARAPYMIMAPIYKLIGTDFRQARLPYTIISVLSIVVLIGITWHLFGQSVATCVAFATAVNPWSIYFGRTAFEAPLAVFFAYTFLLSLMYLRNWWIVLSIIPWILGLYSYQGTSIVYPFIFGIGIICAWYSNKFKYIRPYTLITVLAFSVFLLFFLGLKNSNAGKRLNEFITPDNTFIVSIVNTERKNSIQIPYNEVFTNKFTMTAREIIGKYIGVFSTKYLIVEGEERSTFSMWNHGWFYYLDLIFFFIGLYFMFLINKKGALFLLSLILIAPIPAAITTAGTSYGLRASLIYPSFCIIIGVGMYAIIHKTKQKLLLVGIGILYFLMITNFIHAYFIQNPVNNSEGFGFSGRVLSTYIKDASNSGKNILFIGSGVLNIYRQHLFWNNALQKTTTSSIQQSVLTRNLRIGNAEFIECGDIVPKNLLTSTIITQPEKPCSILETLKKTSEVTRIAKLSDSGVVYEIYNDQLCNSEELSPYQPLISIDDLDVEKLSINRFCQTYISKPTTDIFSHVINGRFKYLNIIFRVCCYDI